MANKTSKKSAKVAKTLPPSGSPRRRQPSRRPMATAPVQAYIAAMPGWKCDVGRRLDALIVRTVASALSGKVCSGFPPGKRAKILN